MNQATAEYLLSVYQTREVIKETPSCRIEAALCSLDGKTYIKRTYPEDKREIFEALAGIECAHIPRIKEVIFDANTTVIEERITGRRLSDILDAGRLTRPQADRIAKQLLDALCVLHANNIIHRDVKPDNILVDEAANIWLIDFGIARLYDEAARNDTQHFGTIGYAPPEQFGFSQSDFRSDLYAAGVTLEEVGKVAGCSSRSAFMKTARTCREFDPVRRYASAAEARKALGQKKRLPVLAAAVLCVALAACCLYLFSTTKNGDEYGNVFLWESILDVYAEQTPYLAIPGGTESRHQISLTEGGEEIGIAVELPDDTLTVKLGGSALPEQEFTFSYSNSVRPDYTGTTVDAEIVFYDMNADGTSELLIALADRALREGASGQILCNTNWRAVWCVGFSEGEGFWQADGMMSVASNQGMIMLNQMGSQELSDGFDSILVLEGRTLMPIY